MGGNLGVGGYWKFVLFPALGHAGNHTERASRYTLVFPVLRSLLQTRWDLKAGHSCSLHSTYSTSSLSTVRYSSQAFFHV